MNIVETECILGNGQNDKKKHFNSNSGDLQLIGEQTYNDWTDEDREEIIDPSPEDDRLSFSADDSLASMEPHSAVESLSTTPFLARSFESATREYVYTRATRQ